MVPFDRELWILLVFEIIGFSWFNAWQIPINYGDLSFPQYKVIPDLYCYRKHYLFTEGYKNKLSLTLSGFYCFILLVLLL